MSRCRSCWHLPHFVVINGLLCRARIPCSFHGILCSAFEHGNMLYIRWTNIAIRQMYDKKIILLPSQSWSFVQLMDVTFVSVCASKTQLLFGSLFCTSCVMVVCASTLSVVRNALLATRKVFVTWVFSGTLCLLKQRTGGVISLAPLQHWVRGAVMHVVAAVSWCAWSSSPMIEVMLHAVGLCAPWACGSTAM